MCRMVQPEMTGPMAARSTSSRAASAVRFSDAACSRSWHQPTLHGAVRSMYLYRTYVCVFATGITVFVGYTRNTQEYLFICAQQKRSVNPSRNHFLGGDLEIT